MLNFTEGCEEGNGLGENLAQYHKVSVARREEYNDALRAADGSNEQTRAAVHTTMPV